MKTEKGSLKTIDTEHLAYGIIQEFERERLPIGTAKEVLKLVEKELDNYIMRTP